MADRTWVHDVAGHLAALGLVTLSDAAGDVFVGHHPPVPDDAVSLWGTPGQPLRADNPMWRPSLQVRVRGPRNTRAATVARCQTLAVALHDLRGLPTVDGELKYLDAVQSWPVDIGVDDNSRPEFTSNFHALIARRGVQ